MNEDEPPFMSIAPAEHYEGEYWRLKIEVAKIEREYWKNKLEKQLNDKEISKRKPGDYHTSAGADYPDKGKLEKLLGL